MKLPTPTPALVVATATSAALIALPAASAHASYLRNGTAAPRVIAVAPGDSIQHAIDRVRTGGTVIVRPGTYHESLTVTKSLRLHGTGVVRLRPPASRPTNACTQDPDSDGTMPAVCIVGKIADPTEEESPVTTPVSRVDVRGFRMRGFTAPAVEAYGVRHLQLVNLAAVRNPGGGIFVARANHVRISHLVLRRNGAQGINVHGAVRNFSIRRSRITHNHGDGVSVSDSNHGVVKHNRIVGNCLGVLLIDLGTPVGGLRHLRVTDNRVSRNNRFCPGDDEGAPSESGTGIALVGARSSTVARNRVHGNRASRPAMVSFGGITLLDASSLTGGAAPAHDRVIGNRMNRNQPQDLLYDGSGHHNVVIGNACNTSTGPATCG